MIEKFNVIEHIVYSNKCFIFMSLNIIRDGDSNQTPKYYVNPKYPYFT